MRRSNILLAICVAMTATAGLGLAAPLRQNFPEGFRNWTHIKSAIGHPPPGNPKVRFDGLHHIYANEVALKGYRVGQFDDGSVLVFDRFGVATDARGIEPTGRLSIDVMIRDSKRYASSGGWGFERFGGEDMRTPLTDEADREQCTSCHRRVEGRGMVFSRLDDPLAVPAEGASTR